MTKIIIEIDLVTRNYKSTTATDNCDKYLHSEKTKKKKKRSMNGMNMTYDVY